MVQFFRGEGIGRVQQSGAQTSRPTGLSGCPLSADCLLYTSTLMFRSPTCTPMDERAARALAEIAGVDLEKYADAMFEAGGDITGKTAEEVFRGDYKIFTSGEVRFGVGQMCIRDRDTLGATLYLAGREAKTGELLHDATSCSMCRRLIINAGIQRVVIHNTDRDYSVVPVSYTHLGEPWHCSSAVSSPV